jgi:hypothetical protein
MTISDDFSNFLTHLTTFHDHVKTFVMTAEDLLTLGDDLLMTLTTGDYLVMIHDDNSDDPCDNTDNL